MSLPPFLSAQQFGSLQASCGTHGTPTRQPYGPRPEGPVRAPGRPQDPPAADPDQGRRQGEGTRR